MMSPAVHAKTQAPQDKVVAHRRIGDINVEMTAAEVGAKNARFAGLPRRIRPRRWMPRRERTLLSLDFPKRDISV